MGKIKFGTDGWRAIIAQEYTVDNVLRVSEGTAKWMIGKSYRKAVIGYDCRFGGKLFSETAARVLASYGITVYYGIGVSSTPMVSLGIVKTSSDLGIVITASHNPPSYNGFKLKSSFGGPTLPKEIAEVENLVPDSPIDNIESFETYVKSGLIIHTDLEEIYLQHVYDNFDVEAIKQYEPFLAYDAMFGAGQSIMKRLFPKAHHLHAEMNPSFNGQAPEPIHKNLLELSSYIKNHPSIKLGIAHDGDADRIGMYDSDGKFVDSHHILLLLLVYLKEYKKETGKAVVSFSVTNRLQQLGKYYGVDVEVTKIGFKYIAGVMIEEDVIVAGEESGGIAVKGHIPERDGVWIALIIMEFMAKTGKTVQELIELVYDKVGSFDFNRNDLHLTEEKKQDVVARCKAGSFKSFGKYKIDRLDDLDGFKYFFDDDRWVMIRPSGTEPVLRVYAQAPTMDEVNQILEATIGEF